MKYTSFNLTIQSCKDTLKITITNFTSWSAILLSSKSLCIASEFFVETYRCAFRHYPNFIVPTVIQLNSRFGKAPKYISLCLLFIVIQLPSSLHVFSLLCYCSRPYGRILSIKSVTDALA